MSLLECEKKLGDFLSNAKRNNFIICYGLSGTGKTSTITKKINELKTTDHKIVTIAKNSKDVLKDWLIQMKEDEDPPKIIDLNILKGILMKYLAPKNTLIVVLDHIKDLKILYMVGDLMRDDNIKFRFHAIITSYNFFLENDLDEKVISRGSISRVHFPLFYEQDEKILKQSLLKDKKDEKKIDDKKIDDKKIDEFLSLEKTKTDLQIGYPFLHFKSHFLQFLLGLKLKSSPSSSLQSLERFSSSSSFSSSFSSSSSFNFSAFLSYQQIIFVLCLIHLELKNYVTYNFYVLHDHFKREFLFRSLSSKRFQYTIEESKSCYISLLERRIIKEAPSSLSTEIEKLNKEGRKEQKHNDKSNKDKKHEPENVKEFSYGNLVVLKRPKYNSLILYKPCRLVIEPYQFLENISSSNLPLEISNYAKVVASLIK